MIAPKLPKNEALGEKGREAISRAVVISIRPIALETPGNCRETPVIFLPG